MITRLVEVWEIIPAAGVNLVLGSPSRPYTIHGIRPETEGRNESLLSSLYPIHFGKLVRGAGQNLERDGKPGGGGIRPNLEKYPLIQLNVRGIDLVPPT